MAQVTVTIAGKTYRMACADGEESHLEGLADLLDGKIAQMREAFGEIGDMRLQVMAALTIADELAEARASVAKLREEVDALKTLVADSDARIHDNEERHARAIVAASERVERLARSLAAPIGAAASPDDD
ncbi:MAG: cell division protein ZapA [Salinarimonadaceae bacterium]|nr:MAG: cell division protein ZapA [Salinarimonadaceae bacterium]